ncbi:MAG: hypothetical protein RLP02_14680, partial [Coleofasciculus sp. C2-GNP5-27]
MLGIPAIGFIGAFIALFGVGSQAFQLPLQTLVGRGVLSNKMAGWREFSEYTNTVVAQNFADENPVIVTDNYNTAAQLLFATSATDVYTSDQDMSVRDGRNLQLSLWDMDLAAMKSAVSGPILFITEDSTLNILEKDEVIDEMCSHVDGLRFVDSLLLFNGDKQFSYYHSDK